MVREGQQTTECNLLLRGFAFARSCSATASRQIISIHIPSEFVDLQNGSWRPRTTTSKASTDSEVAAVPRSALMELADKRPAVRLAMWIDTLIDASIFREWVVNVGPTRFTRAHLASFMRASAAARANSAQGRDGIFDFPLTQEQLADCDRPHRCPHQPHASVSPPDGLIQLTAGVLTVLDWERLREVGDFDELYLHQKL